MLDSLTLDQMRVLIAVAEAGSFSAAARKLGRVQSAVSQAMQVLEETLRVRLFDRSAKIPVLTDGGRMVLNDARQVVQRADALRSHAETIAGGTEPELAFAVDPLFPTDILMESLRALQAAFPCLPVTLLTEGLGATEQRLARRTSTICHLFHFDDRRRRSGGRLSHAHRDGAGSGRQSPACEGARPPDA